MPRLTVLALVLVASAAALFSPGTSTGVVVWMLLTIAWLAMAPRIPEEGRRIGDASLIVSLAVSGAGIVWLPAAAFELVPRLLNGPSGESRRSHLLYYAEICAPLTAVFFSLFGQMTPQAVYVIALSVTASVVGRMLELQERRIARLRSAFDTQRERALHWLEHYDFLEASRESDLSLATLEERARLAREIHDNVGHLLTRSVLQLEALLVVHGNDDALAASLGSLRVTLDEALSSVRSSVRDLHDHSLDLRRRLAHEVNALEGVDVRLVFDAAEPPARVAATVLAVAREGLSNAVRHGAEGTLTLSFVGHPAFWQLVIENRGARRAEGSAGTGLGLVSMEERVLALGGNFRAGPTDTGYRVFASIPREGE